MHYLLTSAKMSANQTFLHFVLCSSDTKLLNLLVIFYFSLQNLIHYDSLQKIIQLMVMALFL